MPCHVEEMPVNFQKVVEAVANGTEGQLTGGPWYSHMSPKDAIAIAKRMNALQAENDKLREHIIELSSGEHIDPNIAAQIEAAQIQHRAADIKRLTDTFQKKINDGDTSVAKHLVAVMKATPLLPLEQQLGFDPNSY